MGQVAPPLVHYGGDPTGLYQDLTWRNWGDAQAVAIGKGWFVPADAFVAGGHYEPVVLVAFDLDQCAGQLAYRHLGSFFPLEGERFDVAAARSASYDMCTGP